MKKSYLLIIFLSLKLIAQTPVLDNTFNSKDDGKYEQYIGENSVLLPDGKLLSINMRDNEHKIMRLNEDGKIDPTFNFSDNSTYPELYAKSDGKFLKIMRNYNGLDNTISIKNYNSDGSPNLSFIPPILYGDISDVLYQNDGRILIIGSFTKVNNSKCSSIVRLNTDGTVDNTFNLEVVFPDTSSTYLASVVLQNDGSYIVAGDFAIYDATTQTYQYRLVRLKPNGTIDKTFSINSTGGLYNTINGIDFNISKIMLQPDNKIIACNASFRKNGYIVSRRIFRLNSDGSRDLTFNANISSDYNIDGFCIQDDGKIVFLGDNGLERLNTDGTKDNTFVDRNTTYINFPTSVYIQKGKIIYNQNYKSPDGLTRYGITRLNLDASLDLSFNPQAGTNILSSSIDLSSSSELSNSTVLMDGKILTFGCFTSFNDIAFNHICKLTQDGQLDPNFVLDPKISFSFDKQGSNNSKIKQQKDGKILFTSTNLITIKVNEIKKDFIRINENGSLDNTFNFDSGNTITDFKIQSDGKIVVIGTGPLFTDNSKYKMIRINSDGTIDTSFQSKLFTENLTSLEVQDDNKILAIHPNIWDYTANRSTTLERFNPDGSLETSFVPAKTSINYSKLQPDGKIIISYYDMGKSTTFLGRLNNDGSVDNSFTENYVYGTENNRSFSMIFLTSQGKIVITPILNSLNNNTINKKFIILSKDGMMENSFGDPKIISNSVIQQNCDALIISGDFSEIDGNKKNNIVRYNLLNNTPVPMPGGNLLQTFTEGQTLADLKLEGQNIVWYNTQNLCSFTNTNTNKIKNTNVVLPSNTLLVEGTTYFASQIISGVESNYRLAITVSKTLGTIDPIFENLKTYPNPIEKEFTISNNSNIDRVEIYDLLGQIIFNEKYDSTNLKLDFSNFKTGLYIAKVYSNGNIKSIKIIKH